MTRESGEVRDEDGWIEVVGRPLQIVFAIASFALAATFIASLAGVGGMARTVIDVAGLIGGVVVIAVVGWSWLAGRRDRA